MIWHHPKYYKELKRIANEEADKRASEQAGGRVGPKDTSSQATSDQASSGSRTNKR